MHLTSGWFFYAWTLPALIWAACTLLGFTGLALALYPRRRDIPVLTLLHPVTLVLDAGGRTPDAVHVLVTAGLIFVPVVNGLSIVCWVVFSLRAMASDVYFWFNPPKLRKWEHLQSGVHPEAPASTLPESDK
jgi:hypothetical protein